MQSQGNVTVVTATGNMINFALSDAFMSSLGEKKKCIMGKVSEPRRWQSRTGGLGFTLGAEGKDRERVEMVLMLVRRKGCRTESEFRG